eukprot:5250084-Ditylum_brightwellii.AAC.1
MLAQLQKSYLYNHIKKPSKISIKNTASYLHCVSGIIKKPSKLSIKNTASYLHCVSGMLVRFLDSDNNPMVENVLCNILHHTVKHDWHNALYKSDHMSMDMGPLNMVDYFE